MPLYLADSMRLVASGLGDDHRMLESAAVAYHRQRCREILDDFDLFVFSSSALMVAADLRIDTPDRMEKVAGAVFEHPARVFLEASYADRMRVFSSLRGFPSTDLPEGRHEPARVGLAIDCAGGGRATISSFWNFRSGEIPAAERKRLAALSGTRLEREAVKEITRIGTTMCRIEVDMTSASPIALAEFETAVNDGEPWALRFFRNVEATMARGGQIEGRSAAEIGRRGLVLEAWRSFRLNALSRIDVDRRAAGQVAEQAEVTGKSPQEVMRDAESDLDGEMIYALAMLAALSAQGDALQRQERPAAGSRAAGRGRRPVSRRDLEVDRLSVLTLDLRDRELAYRIAEEPAGSQENAGRGEGEARQRVRHPVRGHLFRARNGKIVYRRPHWRGGRITKTITRVR